MQERLLNKLGIQSNRTKNITKHVVLSFIYKGGSILCNFLLVPVSIHYLSSDNYGVWLTISSFIGWFSFFDIGFGHGLRNKFAEAKAKGDVLLAKSYISSAYFTIALTSSLLMLGFFVANCFINWDKVFNVKGVETARELAILMPIVFAFFAIQLTVKLITTIYTADQQHSMQGKVTFYIQAISLLAIWLITRFNGSSLLVFGGTFSAIPVLILTAFSFYAFSKRYASYKPSLKLWKKKYVKDIFGLGMKFFFIQIAGIILFSTDNFIITQLFGPKEVVPYSIAYKYFGMSNMLFTIVIAPFWSSVTEAYAKEDFAWIRKSMRNLTKISMGLVGVVLLMLCVAPWVYKLWVGAGVLIPLYLNLAMALYFILNNLVSPFTNFINGTGKVTVQSFILIVVAVFNVPVSIFFAKVLGLGSTGVIVGTTVCLIPYLIASPIQYFKIVTKKSRGFWNT